METENILEEYDGEKLAISYRLAMKEYRQAANRVLKPLAKYMKACDKTLLMYEYVRENGEFTITLFEPLNGNAKGWPKFGFDNRTYLDFALRYSEKRDILEIEFMKGRIEVNEYHNGTADAGSGKTTSYVAGSKTCIPKEFILFGRELFERADYERVLNSAVGVLVKERYYKPLSI